MRTILNKKKIIILSFSLIVIVTALFIYNNYAIESATTHENDTTSFDAEDSDENDAPSEDIDFPNTIILSWRGCY